MSYVLQEDFEDGGNNGRNAAPAAGANARGGAGKSSFSINTDFDDDDDRYGAGNNNPDRTLPRLRPPVSAVPSSAYGALQDMPSPSGKLSDRIERLRQRCKEALGERVFWEAYNFLKQHEMVSTSKHFFYNDRRLFSSPFFFRNLKDTTTVAT